MARWMGETAFRASTESLGTRMLIRASHAKTALRHSVRGAGRVQLQKIGPSSQQDKVG